MEGGSSASNSGKFKDILEPRRRTSDILWISRQWTPTHSIAQELPTDPAVIRLSVLQSDLVKQTVLQLSREKGVKPEVLYREVEEQLTEIGHNRHVSVLRWIGLFVTKILKKTCSHLMVNEESINKLKSSMGNTPVIFAPSHRSYADFVLMAYICFHFQIEVPCVAAGMDFMSMWLMGRLLRDCCAFFMRRSFTGDALYWAVFSEYVRTLVTSGSAPVEFFIEGTRSRSGKSLVPKYGFLSMAVEPFFRGQIPDILIVPINISYDRVLEEKLFSYELLGVPKPKESTSGLIKAFNAFNEKYGKIFIDFGEAFSLRNFLHSHEIPRPVHPKGPLQVQSSTEEEMAIVRLLSHHIVRSQQNLTVLSSFHLVAVILSNHFLSNKEHNMLLSDLVREVSWFRSVLEMFGATVDIHVDLEEAVRESLSIHKSLVTLLPDGAVQLKAVHLPGTKIDPSQLRGHHLSDASMSLAVPLIMLQLYVNPAMHFLVNPAILTSVMQCLGTSGEITRDDLFSRYRFVRSVLSHEFVLNKSWEEKDFEEALRVLDLVNIVESSTSGCLILGNHRKLQNLLCSMLHPFFSGYIALGRVLLEVCTKNTQERVIIREAQRRVEMSLISGDISHPAALSLDTLSCGLQSFVSLGAIHKIRRDKDVLYVSDLSELTSLLEKLEQLMVPRHIDNKWRWQQLEFNHAIPAKL